MQRYVEALCDGAHAHLYEVRSDLKQYKGLANKHFIMDERDKDPSAPNATDVRYQQWENGGIVYTNPTGPGRENRNVVGPDYWVPDDYKFADVYDSKTQPFHGGVYVSGPWVPRYLPARIMWPMTSR